MNLFNQLKDVIADAEKDAIKFDSKNNVQAGLRLRKSMQVIRSIAVSIRQEVATKNKAIKESRK